jgi:restriction system protein
MWMIRAGEGGFRFEDFKANSSVSIGWHEVGDLSLRNTREDFLSAVRKAYPQMRKGQVPSAAGQLFRFVREIETDDTVITYSSEERVYLIGTVVSSYAFKPVFGDHPNVRTIRWIGQISRDALSVDARNSLGSTLTLFRIPEEVAAEIMALVTSGTSPISTPKRFEDIPDVEQVEDLFRDQQLKSFEFIKDKVNSLAWDEMQELVAGLLRAMGYKTRISPSGSDRGKDIIASPDGLGFEDPRIVVEVKHRNAAMGSQEIRGFLGGPHANDKGLYVSTGGFSKDARYEAERGRIPVTLMDLDDLVKALLEHYENMDVEMQRLIPLRKLYWPA